MQSAVQRLNVRGSPKNRQRTGQGCKGGWKCRLLSLVPQRGVTVEPILDAAKETGENSSKAFGWVAVQILLSESERAKWVVSGSTT